MFVLKEDLEVPRFLLMKELIHKYTDFKGYALSDRQPVEFCKTCHCTIPF